MTDLVTRLRALAELQAHPTNQAALREAADALKNCQIIYDEALHSRATLAELERDALKTRFERLDATLSKVARERDEALAKLTEAERISQTAVSNFDRLAEDFGEAKDRAEKAGAEAAALREAANALVESKTIEPVPLSEEHVRFDVKVNGVRLHLLQKALSQPGPGAALLHKFAIAKLALERIARGGMTVVAVDALAALEEKP